MFLSIREKKTTDKTKTPTNKRTQPTTQTKQQHQLVTHHQETKTQNYKSIKKMFGRKVVPNAVENY